MVDAPKLSPAQQWLVDQWNAGQSATQLGVRTGKTRNAVLGEIHRLRGKGVAVQTRAHAGRMPSAPTPPKAPKSPTFKAVPVEQVKREIPLDPEIAVTVEDARNRQCRWPYGDPAEEAFRYCGRAKFEEHPYCEGHCAHAYQPRKQRQKEVA